MADDNALLYVAIYDNIDAAMADLDVVEQLHDDDVIGKYDAAVVDRLDAKDGQMGKPHVHARVDHPAIEVIPELFNHGPLPQKALKESGNALAQGQAALFVVGEPTIAKALDKQLTKSSKVIKESFDTSVDALTSTLAGALKS